MAGELDTTNGGALPPGGRSLLLRGTYALTALRGKKASVRAGLRRVMGRGREQETEVMEKKARSLSLEIVCLLPPPKA